MNTLRTEPMFSQSHIVQICQNKTAQAKLLTNYISEGLTNNEAVIVIARPQLRKAIWTRLLQLGLDMASYKAQGQIKLYDAELLLSAILIDDVIDEHYFHTFIGSQIEAAQAGYGKVRAFGEMVEILAQRGLLDTAVQLENMRNDLCNRHELTVLCSYGEDGGGPRSSRVASEHVCHCQNPLLPMNSHKSGGTLLELFGTAWTNVMASLTQSQPGSGYLSHPPL